jgi:group I intron endonuclease
MRKFFIYRVTNTINNKVYIGKTECEPSTKRWKGHLTAARNPKDKDHNIYFYKAIRKYGQENFKFEVIDEFYDADSLFRAEILYIQKYKSKNDKYGYNLTDGGDGGSGFKFSEEVKKTLNQDKKTKFLGEKNPFFGKKHTSETKNKISKANTGKLSGDKNPFFGKTHTPETIQIIVDKNKANNKLNPRFGEKAPNYGNKHTLETKEKMSKNSSSKPIINNEDAEEIRRLYNIEGLLQKEIAEKYKISKETVQNILYFKYAYKKSQQS